MEILDELSKKYDEKEFLKEQCFFNTSKCLETFYIEKMDKIKRLDLKKFYNIYFKEILAKNIYLCLLMCKKRYKEDNTFNPFEDEIFKNICFVFERITDIDLSNNYIYPRDIFDTYFDKKNEIINFILRNCISECDWRS